jgi:hypothetical protein
LFSIDLWWFTIAGNEWICFSCSFRSSNSCNGKRKRKGLIDIRSLIPYILSWRKVIIEGNPKYPSSISELLARLDCS